MLLDLLIFLARCFIVIIATWLVVHFIGKKTSAQLTPYDLAILFVIVSMAAQPLASKDPFKTAIGMIVLGIGTVLIAKLSLLRPFYKFDFEPSILIERGVIKEQELRKHRINVYMLLSMLRAKGYFQIEDVYYAILEANGALSVLPKSTSRPLTPDDMKLHPKQAEPGFAVIVDGQVMSRTLPNAGITAEWLMKELRSKHEAGPKDVFFAELDGNRQLKVQLYAKRS